MKKSGVITLLIICIANPAFAASRYKNVKEGNAFYSKGDYESSLKRYREALETDLESDILNFNAGTALYKQKDYQKSIEHIQKALLSEDNVLKKRAYYNLGNALYQYGLERENADIKTAITSLEKAMSSYEGALNIDDKNEDAQYNYDFVKKELERLIQKQQQQKQQDQQQSQDKENNNENQEQQNQSQQDSVQNQEENPQEEDSQENNEDEQEDNAQLAKNNDQQQESEDSTKEKSIADYRQMTKEEADMLLNDYQQKEEPHELLNFMKQQINDKPVLKDW